VTVCEKIPEGSGVASREDSAGVRGYVPRRFRRDAGSRRAEIPSGCGDCGPLMRVNLVEHEHCDH